MGLRTIEVKCEYNSKSCHRLLQPNAELVDLSKFHNCIDLFQILYLDGPSMIISPQTTSGDKMNAIMLFCAVDSNPPPKYYWTKEHSREVATVCFVVILKNYEHAQLC